MVIRNPINAVVSLRARFLEISTLSSSSALNLSAAQLLKSYIRFYTSIMPYPDKYVLGLFEEVTSDFGAVIERINQRFNTNFSIFEHTQENVRKVLKKQGIHAGPSSQRQEIKASILNELKSDAIQDLILEAETVYQQFKLLAQS